MVRVLFTAMCLAGLACRDRGPAPRLDSVEPGDCYNDEEVLLVLRGSFEAPATADLGDPSKSRLGLYSIQLASGDRVLASQPAEFRGPAQLEALLEPGTPPGVYTVVLTDPWGRSAPLVDALVVRLRGAPDGGAPDGGVVRAPPTASFAFVDQGLDLPAGDLSTAVNVDGSGSTDSQTPAAEIRVSWNFTSDTTAPPWTPWSTGKTASYPFSRSGVATVVMAAIDADGDIGYAARAISVSPRATGLCFVTTPLPVDDGAVDCSPSGSGPDGLLSLDEAVRIANGTVGNQTIVLSAPSASAPVIFTGSSPLALTRTTQIVGTPGAILEREIIAQNVPMTLIGLEVVGPNGKLTIPQGYTMVLLDTHLRETRVYVAGHLIAERTRFENCAGACITVDGLSADLVVSQSAFVGAGAVDGIDVLQCAWTGNSYSVDLIANTFFGLATAVRVGAGCAASTRIVHQTFHANGVGLEYLGGDGHVLRNNIFTAQQSAAVQGCNVPFATGGRGDHLLYGNASDGCIGADPGVVRFDPQYVSPATGDFRLRYGSPAVDVAPALGIDANGPAPNNYLGAGADFGGRETY